MKDFNPIESFADMSHEFGEHGSVNMSIETSTAFTVLSAGAGGRAKPATNMTETSI